MTYRKLKNGDLYGQKGRYRAWIYKRPHDGYCAHLNYGGECIAREGYHGTSLPTIGEAKKFINHHYFIKSNLLLQPSTIPSSTK